MNIAKTARDLVNVQAMKYRVASQKGRITRLENRVGELQAFVKKDILTLQEAQQNYVGNKYATYDEAIAEIDKKYNGTADWGVLQTGAIIDLRAAFIIGEGLKIVKKDKTADKEFEWVEEFFRYNDIDREVVQEYAKEAEIEGKLAIQLIPKEVAGEKEDKKDLMISVRFKSYTQYKYTVETDPNDYLDYTKLSWQNIGKIKAGKLEAKEFVYKKFGGRINRPNEAAPKVMKCLTEVESLDKALRDWREINRIFAGPILHIQAKTSQEAKFVQEQTEDKNWKIKKILISTGDMKYAQFDIGGVESLEKEILTHAKMISGTTGIPVHFLGLPELMSNRATAENLMEMILASTSKERQIWKGAYEEIIHKAMLMYNEKMGLNKMSKEKQLDPDKIGIEILVMTAEEWGYIEKIYLPACLAGKISDEAFLDKLPGIDADEEAKRKQLKDESELERLKHENESLKLDKEDKELFGNGNEG